MLNRLFRRNTPQTKIQITSDPIIAYYMPASGGGRVFPIKSTGGNSLNFGLQGFVNSYDAHITSSLQGYASAYIASPWANRATTIRAETMGRFEPKVIQRSNQKEIVNHPLTVAIRRNKQHWLYRQEWSRLIWGETFNYPRQNQYGHYSDVTWLNNLGTDINYVGTEILWYQYMPLEGGHPMRIPPDRMAYFHTANPFSDVRGLSKYETALMDIGIDVDIIRTTRTFYINDARPGLLLIPENDMQVVDAQAFTDYWKSNFQGSRNAGKTVMLPRNIKEVRPLERPPDSVDVELKESVRREILATFGVPLSVAGAWDDASYQSAPEQRKSFYEETMTAAAYELQIDITNHLLPFFGDIDKEEFILDTTNILALVENENEKSGIWNNRLVSGGITLDQYREAQDLPPLPNGKGQVFYIPNSVTIVKAEDMGKPIPTAAPPNPFGQFQMDAPKAIEAPAQNAPSPQLPAPVTETKATKSACVMLSLAPSPDMTALRQRVKEMFPNNPIEWTNPEEDHITLLVAPAATDEQIAQLSRGLARIVVPELDLNIGSMATFDDLARHALYFRIRKNADLESLQEAVYKVAQSCGIQVRTHHTPERYIPHITIGYTPARVRSQTFHTQAMVQADMLKVTTGSQDSDGYETVYEMPIADPAIIEGETSEVTAEDELRQWEAKALNKGAIKAQKFICYVVPEDVQKRIRNGLVEGLDKQGIRTLFTHALKQDAPLPTPDDILKYWKRYDTLMSKVGSVWLADYMRAAWKKLKRIRKEDITPEVVQEVLTPMHEDVLASWVGTPEKPGTLAKIVIAGMAAGNEALRGVNPAPIKAETDVNIAWDLMSEEAYAFVQKYAFNLIKELDGTTTTKVQEAIAKWIESGAGLDELTDALEAIFNDPERAHLIAQTESTRAYAEGSNFRWQEAGVKKVVWRTVNDNDVCALCMGKNGKEYALDNTEDTPPLHPGCRCFRVPKV